MALTTQVWAVPRSLATTWGITICFLFLRVLRCFSSPGLLFRAAPSMQRVPPFGNLRIKGYSAPPRSLSQPITSFIAYKIQGIHHTPLVTFLQNRLFYIDLCCLQIIVLFSNSICQRTCSILLWNCGEYRSRTDDPLLAKQVL